MMNVIIQQKSADSADLIVEQADSAFSTLFWWAVGIALLTVALFMSARMGIYQEVLYKKYGKYPNEALFITVSLSDRNDSVRNDKHTKFRHTVDNIALAAAARLPAALPEHLAAFANRLGQRADCGAADWTGSAQPVAVHYR